MNNERIERLREAYEIHQENAGALKRMGYPWRVAQGKADRIFSNLVEAKQAAQPARGGK